MVSLGNINGSDDCLSVVLCYGLILIESEKEFSNCVH